MNYLQEILAFHDLLQSNQLSTGQIALWYALMYINNKCRWVEWFTAPNQTLELYTGLSRQGISKNRNALKQIGLIDFRSNGTKATAYKMLPMSNSLQDSLQNSSQVVDKIVDDEFTRQLRDSCTLNKQNKNKTKPKKNNDDGCACAREEIPSSENFSAEEPDKGMIVVEYYRNLTGRDVTPNRLQLIDGYVRDGAEPKLICALLDYAVESNVRNVWQYTEAALRANLDKGITTLAAYREEQEKRQREIEQDKSRKQGGLLGKSKFNNYIDPNKIDYDAIHKKIMADMLEE